MSNDLLAAALACINAGVSIVPIDHATSTTSRLCRTSTVCVEDAKRSSRMREIR